MHQSGGAPEPGWEAVRAALGLGDDPRFATPADRVAHDGELANIIAAVFALRTAGEWEAMLLADDVTCVEVSQGAFSEFTISSPTVRENGFVAEVTHPLFGAHLRHGPVVTLSATRLVRPNCRPAHTRGPMLNGTYV